MITPSATFDVLKNDLSRFLPIRIILRKHNDKFVGVVEEAFSINVSGKFDRIWWSGNGYTQFGNNYEVDGIKDAERNAFNEDDIIFDPLSDECPVEIDWKSWKASKIAVNSIFTTRNAPFKIKEIK